MSMLSGHIATTQYAPAFDCFNLVEAGYDIRTIHEQLDHKDMRMTVIYTHLLKEEAMGV